LFGVATRRAVAGSDTTAIVFFMVGKPTIRGMRITVEQILRALAGGVTVNELLKDYPELEQEDMQAVFAYAVNLVDEEQVFPFLCVSK
jgi:uncharacterized protein (DUF433 family)